ncbi:uncharacterized protein LOC143147277 [Ptiloglossa arizonensis]|uniref:uncharacterized protein LOC143147277 n=1 Tax=Ptiloglossa arizonensis TaxID=3350558 RepID=UPI003FA0EEC5
MHWPEDDEYSSIFPKRYSILMAEEPSLPIIYYRSQNSLSSSENTERTSMSCPPKKRVYARHEFKKA